MPLAERGVAWAGFGHHVPERRVPNAEIEAELALPAGWIRARSGIEARHYAAPDQALSDLAIPAGAMALSGVDPGEVGLLLLATSTPDHLLPLFVAMGASQPGEALSFPVTGFEFGSFSHRSVQFGTSTIGR